MTDTTLIVAAHPDDEVLGMGGTLAKLVNLGHDVHVVFFTDGESSRGRGRVQEAVSRMNSAKLAAAVIGYSISNIQNFNFPDNGLDTVPLLDLVQKLEAVIDEVKPNCVYTHHHNDLNIDHRRVHMATMTACRPQPGNLVKLIYEFYVPSSSDWNTVRENHANTFVDISEFIACKYQAIDCYKDEIREYPHQRSLTAIKISDQYFGNMVGLAHAEAFNLIRKLT